MRPRWLALALGLFTSSALSGPTSSERYEDSVYDSYESHDYIPTVGVTEESKWEVDSRFGLVRCEFSCKKTGCIPNYWRCDGEKDCADGEDELDCTITSFPVSCEEVAIQNRWRCDGVVQCKNGEDEMNCPKVSHSPGDLANGTFAMTEEEETAETIWKRMASILFKDI